MDGPPEFRAVYQETFARLYERSAARRWRIAESDFAHMLERAIERRFAADIPNPAEIEVFLDSLHVDDLALAMACRAGNADAWREFDARYHGVIESFVHAIARDTNRAREIEASLYGDLFDAARAGNPRRSPLDHYNGRSAMAAWLRVVIVRREADWLRERYHTNAAIAVAAAEPVESGNHNHAAPADPDRARFIPMLAEAMNAAIAELDPRDRLRLSYYYVQSLTLAESGALLGEHESSVSRNLARIRVTIRRRVARELRREHHLSDEQITRCFEFGTGDWPFDLDRSLSQAK
jgi:RNA polymerase sigma-70 factor